jgi:hypothetical protein
MAKMLFGKLLICVLTLPLIFAACGTSGGATTGTNTAERGMPEWVRDPYTRFDRQTYIAVRGSGNSREFAERSAFGNLVAFFGQYIELNETVTERYQQAVRDGVTLGWSVNAEVDTTIARYASFDSLVGAEIGDIWNDGTSHFAVAILNRNRATQIYTDIVRSNQRMIDNLINIPPPERNTLEGFSRYQFAATVADMTIPYMQLLSAIGAPPVQGFRSGNDLRLEALNITRAIPVNLRVQNDRSGRIQGAFARALSDLGFQSGGSNSRYTLDVNVVSSAVEIANSPHRWTRIEVSANLIDGAFGTVLLPYNFNIREGHTTQSEADNRVILSAERRINQEYANLLGDYLNRLLPKR